MSKNEDLQMFVIDRDKGYKVRATHMVPYAQRGQAQWGALGDCFSIVHEEDFTEQGHTGPEMIQVLGHVGEVKPSYRKRTRAEIAKRVYQALKDANLKLTKVSSEAPRLREQSGRVITIKRQEFKGHKNSRRAKCFGAITSGMTVKEYLDEVTVKLRLTRGQGLGCLQKLADHPLKPYVKVAGK